MHDAWYGGSLAARIVLGESDVLLREGLTSLVERPGFDVTKFPRHPGRAAKGGPPQDGSASALLLLAGRPGFLLAGVVAWGLAAMRPER